MNVLHGIENFLRFINDNWTSIMVIIGLALGVIKKIKTYSSKTDDEKIAIAKEQIHEMILKMISDAEEDYEEWNKAGSIKRSQVIGEIFAKYPVLSKAVNQESLIKWIDDEIDNALVTLRQIVSKNKIE